VGFAGDRASEAVSVPLRPAFYGEDTGEWINAIRAAQAAARPDAIIAHTFLRDYDTSARPVLLSCDNGRDYVVKGQQAGRMLVNDQVIGRLGRALLAPVPRIAIITVPPELTESEPRMSHMAPGLSHGSQFLSDVGDSYTIEHTAHRANRARFARLAVLWGLVSVFDRQYLYSETEPPILYAADHGHAFPRGPVWNRRALLSAGPAELDVELAHACQFTEREIAGARERLRGIDDARIADAVAAPPREWDFPMEDRAALAQYLSRRRWELLERLA
jgi:hypothetical protein